MSAYRLVEGGELKDRAPLSRVRVDQRRDLLAPGAERPQEGGGEIVDDDQVRLPELVRLCGSAHRLATDGSLLEEPTPREVADPHLVRGRVPSHRLAEGRTAGAGRPGNHPLPPRALPATGERFDRLRIIDRPGWKGREADELREPRTIEGIFSGEERSPHELEEEERPHEKGR